MDNNLAAAILLASLFLVTLSFIAYADCVTTTITCNQTNNDTFPCLLANETFEYNYTFIDCSETMGLGFMGNYMAPSSSQYAPGKDYTFNIIINQLENLQTVYFEANYTTNASQSGTLFNYTYPNVTNSSDVFTIVLTDLPVQKFTYRWIGINATHYGATGTLNFTITKADNLVRLYFNGTENENKTYMYPEIANSSAASDGGTVYLYRNETEISNGTSLQTEQIGLVNGTYVYKANATGNENYSDNTTGVTYYVLVNKGVPVISISITPDIAVVFGNETTVIGVENNTGDDDVNYTLKRDDGLVANITNETAILPLGLYTYTFDASEGDNWSARSISATLTIQDIETAGVFIPSSSGTVTADTSVDRKKGNANVTIYTISSGSTKNITILKTEDMAVRKLSIKTKNKVSDAKITITKLQSLPSTVSYEPSAMVYNYLSIEKQNVTDSDFERIIIRFAVTKQWVSDNEIDYRNIRLYRWSNNAWSELTTNYTSNDSTEYFYEASTPGFSTFAIGDNNTISEGQALEQSSCTELWSCTAWSECSDGLQTRVCTDDSECGTVNTKPAESQECGIEESEVVAEPFPVFEVSVIIIVAMIVIVFVVLELTGKLHLGNLRKKSAQPETAIEDIIKPRQTSGNVEYYYKKKDSDNENGQ